MDNKKDWNGHWSWIQMKKKKKKRNKKKENAYDIAHSATIDMPKFCKA